MFQKLTSFAGRTPVRAAKVMFVLAVALAVVVLGVLVGLTNLGDLFESPYPSETTSLSWADGSVVWTEARTVIIEADGGYLFSEGEIDASELYAEFDGWGRNYSNMRVHWEFRNAAIGGSVANDSMQLELSSGSEATVVGPMGGIFTDDGQEVDLNLVITDLLGNGAFDRGDRIVFETDPSVGASIYEDEVHTIALAYVDPQHQAATYVGEFNFAFHNGEFYSWSGSELNWNSPWYEY
jgi:hypothetical protein